MFHSLISEWQLQKTSHRQRFSMHAARLLHKHPKTYTGNTDHKSAAQIWCQLHFPRREVSPPRIHKYLLQYLLFLLLLFKHEKCVIKWHRRQQSTDHSHLTVLKLGIPILCWKSAAFEGIPLTWWSDGMDVFAFPSHFRKHDAKLSWKANGAATATARCVAFDSSVQDQIAV